MLNQVPLRASLGAAAAPVHLLYITPYDNPVFRDPLLVVPLVLLVALLLHALIWSGLPQRLVAYVALVFTVASLPSVGLQSVHGFSALGVHRAAVLGAWALLAALTMWSPAGPASAGGVARQPDVEGAGPKPAARSAPGAARRGDGEQLAPRSAEPPKPVAGEARKLGRQVGALQRQLGEARSECDRLGKLLLIAGDRWMIGKPLPGLNQGGMSTVYEVTSADPEDRRRYAMKLAHLGKNARHAHDQHRLLREASIFREIGEDPHVVPVIDAQIDTENGYIYLVMPFYEHGTLEDQIALGATLRPLKWWVPRIVFLLEGLDVFHAAGFMHRDIKPANLLLDLHLMPVLADVGLARTLGTDQLQQTISFHGWGTRGYAAPEQCLPATVHGPNGPVANVLDARVDLYAVGALLYRLLTGWFPYEAEAEARAMDWHRLMLEGPQLPLPEPRTLNPVVPAELSELVLSLVMFDREHRARGADGRTLSALDIASWLTTIDLGAASDRLLTPLQRDESLAGRMRQALDRRGGTSEGRAGTPTRPDDEPGPTLPIDDADDRHALLNTSEPGDEPGPTRPINGG